MKHLRLIIGLLCAPALIISQTTTPPAADGPTVTLTPEQTASIMKQLDLLDSQVGKNRGDTLGGALARCSRAAAEGEKSALALYLECYKVEHFDRVNLKITDFQDWQKRNMDKHKDPEFLLAIWLQLQYLVLSIQAQDAKEKDIPTLVASLQTFIPKVVAAIQGATKHTAGGAVKEADKGGKGAGPAKGGRGGGGGGRSFDSGGLQQMLRQSVKGSEFSKAFRLEDFLKKEDWEYEPLAIGSIYEQTIFPYYVEKKPAELGAQWDTRIKADLTIKQAVMSDSEYAIYYKEKYPTLLWKRAKYLYDNNVNPVLAMADMLKVIRDNPTHADATDWLKVLRDAVTKAQPPGPPTAPAAGALAPSATNN